MFRAPADPVRFRRQYLKKVLLPIGILALAVMIATAFGIYWAATTSNKVSLSRQIRLTELALSSGADQLAYEQQGLANWQQLSDQLRRARADSRWLDVEVGQWLRDMYRHDMTFILDGEGRPVYGFVEGEPLSTDLFRIVEPDLRPLIKAVRKAGAAGGKVRSTALTRADTLFEGDAIEVDNRPAAASVMPIPATGKASREARPLLVSVRFLDEGFLQEMASWNLIEGLRFSQHAERAAGETMVEFKDARGKRIGFFFWKPDLPGHRIYATLGPAAALLILVMFGAMAVLARGLWRTGRELATAVVSLQASEAQAQHLAFHDVLTGLPNRALFHDRLDQALARARRGQPCAVLALDLDRFKEVNDTLGHSAGDALIRIFAGRICAIIRSADTLARMGGDEFSILLCDASRRSDVEQLCERVLAAVREPFDLLGNQVFVGVSIGVALAPEDGTDRGELVRKADIALYRAKADGRDRYRMFEPAMDETVKMRREIEADLRQAIAGGGGLHVHFQPQVDAGSQKVVGLEALLRWNHPTRGNIPPDQIIPIAEETGLISPLGDWVLAEACRVARRWPDLFVAVNVSAVQFRSADLAERIVAIAAKAGCAPRQIELEITESVLLDEDDVACRTLQKLREAGFRIALDDFGTGYSSLNYLRQLKVDKIKIDQSFTQNLVQDHQAAAIVSSVVTLGHAMGLTVTAEGVESRDQMNLLSAAGCNELQGHLFARALPEAAIADLMAGRTRLADVA